MYTNDCKSRTIEEVDDPIKIHEYIYRASQNIGIGIRLLVSSSWRPYTSTSKVLVTRASMLREPSLEPRTDEDLPKDWFWDNEKGELKVEMGSARESVVKYESWNGMCKRERGEI